MTIRRTLLAALTAAALIAPAAQARPADIHAPLARAAANAQPKQDLRSPDARDAGQHLRRSAVNAPGATAADSASQKPAGQKPAIDDGSPVPVLPIVAGVLVVLAAALMARYGVHRRTRIAA